MLRKRSIILSVVILVASLLIQPLTSAQQPYDELFYSSNDILYYDPNSTICADETTNITAEGNVESSDNVKAFIEYFTGKGFSLAAAAGMAGNIKQESGFNPKVIEGGANAPDNYTPVSGVGFGIAQWTSSDRQINLVNFAKSQGKPVTNMSVQLGFLWKEMQSSEYDYMVQKLNSNKDDPVAAAAVFHGLTPNIEREGSGINPLFTASGAKYGFERSGDTSDTVITVRGGNATTYFKNYQGHIQDGSGVAGVSEDAFDEVVTDCEDGSTTGDDIGVGKGEFTDSGEVAGWDTVYRNSQVVNKAFGTSLVAKGWCAAITSRTWRGEDIGYGESWAIHLWEKYGDSKGHKDRKPKKGAILLYSGSRIEGHVVIYLGNNKILNDGNITDANFVEEGGWNQTYLGWIDPNDVGWSTKSATEAKMKSILSRYL